MVKKINTLLYFLVVLLRAVHVLEQQQVSFISDHVYFFIFKLFLKNQNCEYELAVQYVLRLIKEPSARQQANRAITIFPPQFIPEL